MDSKQIFEIVHRVRQWDADVRIDLARRILETVVPPRPPKPPKTIPLEEIFGMLKTDGPPPTDEECKKIIEEERLKKYR